MAVLAVAVIAAVPVAAAAATATAGTAAATGGVAVAATGGTTASGTVTGAVSVGISTGPVGWMVLGCSTANSENVPVTEAQATYSFDCWKPVLHDQSTEQSNGMLLKDVAADPRIKSVTVTDKNSSLPDIILQNIWDEKFRIEYLELQTASKGMVTHAVRI